MNNRRWYLLRAHHLYEYIHGDGSCVYCGAIGDTKDHFTPISFAAALAEINIRPRGLFIVPCCRECNGIASNKVFKTVGAKRRYIQWKLMKKHWKLLQMPSWSERELREVNERMRAYIRAELFKRNSIMERISWRNGRKNSENVNNVVANSRLIEIGESFVPLLVNKRTIMNEERRLWKSAAQHLRKHNREDKMFVRNVLNNFGYDEALTIVKMTTVKEPIDNWAHH